MTGFSSSWLRWGLIFSALFLAIHWQEVSSPTWNVDDWALLGQSIDQANQSRPGWDLVYGSLFQHAYSPFFGWLLAAGSIYALAAALALFVPAVTPPWICLLALLISGHAYLLDLFNFSFAIGLYLLPAALSVWGAVLIAYRTGPPLLGRRWLDAILGLLAVAFALSIYQPTGYIGIALLGWNGLARALGSRPFGLKAPKQLVAGVLTGGFGYYLVSRLAMAGQTPNTRTGFASLERFWHKLTDGGVHREVYATDVSLLPRIPQQGLAMLFLLLLALTTVQLLRVTPKGPQRTRRLGSLWAAAGFLTLVPFLLYYILDAGFPSRAFCLGIVAVLATMAAPLTAQRLGVPWLGWNPTLARGLVGLLVVGYLVPQAAFASRVWELTALMQMRDMALSQSILADVRAASLQGGTPAESFSIFGTTERTEPFAHWSSVGESAFRREWSIPALFLNLHQVKVNHIAYRSEANEAEVRAGLPPCRAYPQPGAIVAYQGRWLVCLEANPAAAPERR
ncbi:MAG: hypothetical protein NT158_04535 [Cyanobacteria bacterium]|nr:hypothetical protein [Cyanobacteriota bacterium]